MPRINRQDPQQLNQLATLIKTWSKELGFQQAGISDIDLSQAEQHLNNWLDNGFHGSMYYMQRHGLNRTRPDLLEPGTLRVISVRMDYLPETDSAMQLALANPVSAYISRYALGRDYHKTLRNRLKRLADQIQAEIGVFGYRVFTDSAPVMEKALAEKAGLGWIGKHTNLINRKAGSWFFLGEIYTDLPLPVDESTTNHCGECRACLEICPTQAFVAPYQLDARRCISYLTIELQEGIPEELRPLIGNRIYGCDDCQLVCPWNRFAKLSSEIDFKTRHGLDSASLLEVFAWTEQEFLAKTEGSAIRRIGYMRWLRNIAVALGNVRKSAEIVNALNQKLEESLPDLVREHISWALLRQTGQTKAGN
jgi:epoxyqueuosine reductase